MAPKVEPADDPLAGFERGKPAPATLFGVMGEDGQEREVSTEQPERGHVLVQRGENVEQHLLDRIAAHHAHAAAKAAAAAAQAAAEDAEPDSTPGDAVNASDAAVALAKANDVDLASVAGTGPGGRVLKPDVEAAIKAKAATDQ